MGDTWGYMGPNPFGDLIRLFYQDDMDYNVAHESSNSHSANFYDNKRVVIRNIFFNLGSTVRVKLVNMFGI